MKKILITGCVGFIGFHLSKKLLNTRKNFKIYGLDNLNNYYDVDLKKSRLKDLRLFKKKFEIKKIDLCNLKLLEEFYKKNKFDYVINLQPKQVLDTQLIS